MRTDILAAVLKTVVVVFLMVPSLMTPATGQDDPFQKGLQSYFQENYNSAKKHFSDAVRSDSQAPRVQFFLGNTLNRLGDTEGAIRQYQRTLDLQASHQSAREKLADIYFTDGQWSRAADEYQYLAQRNPETFKFHHRLGVSQFRQGKFTEAKTRFLRARQLNPESAEAHYYLGRVLLNDGEYLNAASRFNRAIELKPSDAKYYFYRGLAYFRDEDYRSRNVNNWRSANDFQRALDQGAGSPRTRFMYGNSLLNRGLYYLKNDRTNEAIKLFKKSVDQYRRVLATNWRASNAFHNMAIAYLGVGKLNFAKNAAERAILSEPDTPFFHDTLGEIYYRLGDFDKAIESWNLARELNPDYQNHPFQPLYFNRSIPKRIEEAKLRR